VLLFNVRSYLRYGLPDRDVEQLLAERGVSVDHVSIYRWVQRSTPEFAEAAGRADMFLVTGGSRMRRT
jgi:IS6 family transposase